MLSKLSAKANNTEGSSIPLEILLYILLCAYFVWLSCFVDCLEGVSWKCVTMDG